VFERRGADLFCTIPISIAQAALGATIKVPTLTGEEELEVPEGTQSGQIFSRKSKGRDCLNGRSRPPMLSSGMHRIPIPLLSRLHFLWRSRSRLCCTCGIGAVCRWWPGGVVVNVAARRWALRRADTEWTKQAAALRQARLMMRLRLIRRVWATCAACGAEYGYDAHAHTFHRARSGPPDDQGSSAACPLKL
jgi:hypothetical protein